MIHLTISINISGRRNLISLIICYQTWRKLSTYDWGSIWNLLPQTWYFKYLTFNTLCIPFELGPLLSLTCRFVWIIQIILYLIPHYLKQLLNPLLTETAKCYSLTQLCNNIPKYLILHTVLRCTDILQNFQNVNMGGNTSENGCLVCSNPS